MGIPGQTRGRQRRVLATLATERNADEAAAPLREAWYYALPSRKLRRGRTLAKRMLGEPVLLGRADDGTVFALRDLCPHRAMPRPR